MAAQATAGDAATAGYAFTGDPSANQVSLVAGEKIVVLVRSNPEWWWVRKVGGAEGYGK